MTYPRTIFAQLGVTSLPAGLVGVTILSSADGTTVLRARSTAVVEVGGGVYRHVTSIDEEWWPTAEAKWDVDGEPAGVETLAIRGENGLAPEDGSSDDFVVDHNTGGADNLAFKDANDDGIDDAHVSAILKSDYLAGSFVVRDRSRTDPAGQWRSPMTLARGIYRFVFDRAGYESTFKDQEVA